MEINKLVNLKKFMPQMKSRNLLAIDLSSKTVKMLELQRRGLGYCVAEYASANLPQGAIAEGSIKNPQAIGELIHSLVDSLSTKTRQVAISLPVSSVITKTLQIEADLTEEEMEAQIAIESKRYIPYPLEDICLDFTVLGNQKINPSSVEVVDVLLVATHKQNVESRIELLEYAGLTAEVVDVESYALSRAVQLIAKESENYAEKTIAIVDIGATLTTFTVLNKLNTVYMREEIFGGDQLTQEIQRRYGLSFNQAVEAKITGGLPDDYEIEVLDLFQEAIVALVQRFLDFFFSASELDKIDAIYLAGGVAMTPDLVSLLEKRLAIPTAVANPLDNIILAQHIEPNLIRQDASSLMVCCGLALRSFE